jgi:hypothetical protein
MVEEISQQQQQQSKNYFYPNQMSELMTTVSSLTKLLTESSQTLSILRRELRGESLFQSEDGQSHWVQLSKPTFVKTEPLTQKPLRENVKMPNGEMKLCYVPNDEAIEEILSMFSAMGLNKITPLTNLKEDIILEDLKIFECKLAATLCLKQKEWGIDKELLPMLQTKISTMVQDARYQSREGLVLKALQTTVSRVEQSIEGAPKQSKLNSSPYN